MEPLRIDFLGFGVLKFGSPISPTSKSSGGSDKGLEVLERGLYDSAKRLALTADLGGGVCALSRLNIAAFRALLVERVDELRAPSEKCS